MSIWNINLITNFSRNIQIFIDRGTQALGVTVHIAPPVMLGFSTHPNLSNLTRSKCGTPWHGFRNILLFPYKIWQRERPRHGVFLPLHRTSSSLEKLLFFHMAYDSFQVNALKFWLVLPLTVSLVGKARIASPSICMTFGWWDPTLTPLCPTASSATTPRPLACLRGCRAAWIYVSIPTATKGHRFNHKTWRSDRKMLPPQNGCSIVSWETARHQAAGGAGAEGFEYSPFWS